MEEWCCSGSQTEFKWSRLLGEKADLIVVNCQGCITGLLLSLPAPNGPRFIPFDARLKFYPDIALTQKSIRSNASIYAFRTFVIVINAGNKAEHELKVIYLFVLEYLCIPFMKNVPDHVDL